MIRGTTPTHVFKINADLTGVVAGYLTYLQPTPKGDIKLEKKLSDLTITDKTITVTLSQEDTLAFAEDFAIFAKFKGRFPDGTVVENRKPVRICSHQTFKDEVI